eukprot:CAMPEP_0114524734 /NCGR_PEP_ID=MMETSP0109-20121206/22025_1 /TAXON_ID=29199 /ORGANISM="Chlorarachnion reptans, Strain CCCM449" /LENGTH=511 /DNA_ID=CAMNT_0001706221 /DNA_START=369 /DNA_END=1901 /DNA_ORIENTATION=+
MRSSFHDPKEHASANFLLSWSALSTIMTSAACISCFISISTMPQPAKISSTSPLSSKPPAFRFLPTPTSSWMTRPSFSLKEPIDHPAGRRTRLGPRRQMSNSHNCHQKREETHQYHHLLQQSQPDIWEKISPRTRFRRKWSNLGRFYTGHQREPNGRMRAFMKQWILESHRSEPLVKLHGNNRGRFAATSAISDDTMMQSRKRQNEDDGLLESGEGSGWDNKYSNSRGNLKYGTWKLQGVRDTMEDQYDVIEKGRCGFLYASVFDGHGGNVASDYLREHLYDVFSEAIEAELPEEVAPIRGPDSQNTTEALRMEDPVDSNELQGLSCPISLTRVLTRMFEDTDRKLLGHLETVNDTDQASSGSTATVALVRKDRIVVANVGDSRAVLGRGNEAIDLSKEHRAYGDSDITWNEIARIEDTGAWVDDGRVLDILGITRAFGDPDFKGKGLEKLKKTCVENGYWAEEFAESLKFTGDPIIVTPDVTEIRVSPEDDVLIVASDGLWDVYDSGEAV